MRDVRKVPCELADANSLQPALADKARRLIREAINFGGCRIRSRCELIESAVIRKCRLNPIEWPPLFGFGAIEMFLKLFDHERCGIANVGETIFNRSAFLFQPAFACVPR